MITGRNKYLLKTEDSEEFSNFFSLSLLSSLSLEVFLFSALAPYYSYLRAYMVHIGLPFERFSFLIHSTIHIYSMYIYKS